MSFLEKLEKLLALLGPKAQPVPIPVRVDKPRRAPWERR